MRDRKESARTKSCAVSVIVVMDVLRSPTLLVVEYGVWDVERASCLFVFCLQVQEVRRLPRNWRKLMLSSFIMLIGLRTIA